MIRRLSTSFSFVRNNFVCNRRIFNQAISGVAPFRRPLKSDIEMSSDFRFFTQSTSSVSDQQLLAGLNEAQVKLLAEQCILVDEMDKVTGTASKMDCHLMQNINTGLLHRAFSLFLFNKSGEMLLQQRSTSKITYPDHFTNACCSHPLYTPRELEQDNAIGVRRAAQRRVKQELGITPEQIPLKAIHYVTRVHYLAANVPRDGKWGEHEIDYVLFAQCNVDLEPNPNEVKSTKYLDKKGMKDFLATADDRGILLTPWFRLIADNFLFQWWDNLQSLSTQFDHKTIYRLL